mmetsp:Transcript_7500/g.13553  ORF Transcript_7500/g.13553 Transcript_7500/m.13553 type:complete len:489 (-) Transcript_7500:189-1655(-)
MHLFVGALAVGKRGFGRRRSHVQYAPRCTQRAVVLCAIDPKWPPSPKSLRVLVVGSGGREHALANSISSSPLLDQLFVAPGNIGMANCATLLSDVSAEDIKGVIAAAEKIDANFVVVGPEVPLVDGLVDQLATLGIPAFGPSASAAVLEGSKTFSKDFMIRHSIPSAWYGKFDSEHHKEAKAFVRRKGVPIVIKADGLAAGKGVVLARSFEEADEAIDSMLLRRDFGSAGASIVIEEFLVGEEASFFAILDGEKALALASAQDHKAAYDGDKGPNTGGMGAYSPAPVVTAKVERDLMEMVVLPTARGMAKEGRPFRGVLFVGAMITEEGLKVLEYNVRFGDPECQVLLQRLKSDLLSVLYSASIGRLGDFSDGLEWSDETAMVVVMASKGYPGDYSASKGSTIRKIEEANALKGVKVFHAGTRFDSDKNEVVAIGGRVLGVTATGESVQEAQNRVYEAVKTIEWPEGFFRTDIGWRALSHLKADKKVL